MDDLLGAQRKKEINFRQFFEKYKQKLNNDLKPQTDIDIYKALKLFENVGNDNLDLLKANCNIDNLVDHTSSALRSINFVPGATEIFCVPKTQQLENLNIELKTFKSISKWKETNKSNPFTRTNESYKRAALPETKNDVEQPPSLNDDELIVTVRFYRPTRAIHNGQTLERPVFTEEFQCLGSNYLVELRDKISCICNGKKFFDISNGPFDVTESKNTDDTDPAYFFIHDTFYNDKRNPANPDYSATLIEWTVQRSASNKIPFKVADMSETRFIDLTASLGYPQQYMHHGNCEHIFVISQLEYLPASHISPKSPSKSLFPYLSTYNIYTNSTCYMCGVRKYCFIVEQSKRQLYDPSYLCKICYKSFHFIDGKKVGHFKAYQIYKENDSNPRSEDNEQLEANEQMEANEESTNSCTDTDE